MNTNLTKNVYRGLVFSFALLVSAACSAWHVYGGYYQRDYYGRAGWAVNPTTIAVPSGLYGASYYGSSCYTHSVCDLYNRCWIESGCN